MTRRTAAAFWIAFAAALGPAGRPSAQQVTPATYVPVDRPVAITAIPGVVAGEARWEVVFSSTETQDGIVGTPDGGLLVAMQDYDVVRKIAPTGSSTVYLGATHGAGALAMDTAGRLFAVQRKDPTSLAQLAPAHRVIAATLPDGKSVGRLSDIVTDLKGGFYMTGGGFEYIDPRGAVTVLYPDIQTNGIALSPDGKTLYVTNVTELVAFTIGPDGMPGARRTFNRLDGDSFPDGTAIDAAGRVYVGCASGVHVIAPDGRLLGVIPTPRRVTSLAFSGPGKTTLYMVAVGATKPDGTMLDMSVSPNARTLYRLPMLTEGFKGRPK